MSANSTSSSASSAAAAATSTQLLTGPYFVGNLLSYCLLGVLILQVYLYVNAFPKDRWALKATVATIVFLDILVTVLSTILGWHALVTEWGSPFAFAPFHWSLAPLPLVSSLVGMVAQAFYAWRIFSLQKSIYLPIFIMLVSLTSVALGGFCGIRGQIIGIARDAEVKPEVIVWLGGSTLCDISLTLGMVFSLFRHGSRSNFATTRSITSKLITLTIETGMVTAFTSLIELVLFLVYPATNMHFLGFLCVSKLYSNCLLATLNARTRHRAAYDADETSRKNPLWIDIDTKRTYASTPALQITRSVTQRRDVDVEMLSFGDIRESTSVKKHPQM